MANRKSILYVGGLDPEVSEELLHASFIVFGDIKSVQIPKDFKISKSKITEIYS
jgi:peptidyl-prolyl isomerase E (cyclophilin E)